METGLSIGLFAWPVRIEDNVWIGGGAIPAARRDGRQEQCRRCRECRNALHSCRLRSGRKSVQGPKASGGGVKYRRRDWSGQSSPLSPRVPRRCRAAFRLPERIKRQCGRNNIGRTALYFVRGVPYAIGAGGSVLRPPIR